MPRSDLAARMATGTPAVLPDDALAAVLGRLPARSLAASRCVCQAWRRLVDERRLLLPHVLPHAVRGLFVNYRDLGRPHFFARPGPATARGRRRVDGELSFIPRSREDYRWFTIEDHCNGLVLHSPRPPRRWRRRRLHVPVQPRDAGVGAPVTEPSN